MGDGKTTERQRLLEGRITALEAEAKAANLRLEEMADQLAMMAHHVHRLSEPHIAPSRRTH